MWSTLVILCTSLAYWSPKVYAFEIQKGLSSSDRREIVRTIGMNSANKPLSNPYPLGGYSGFEVGVSVEFINVRDIRRLGCTPGTAGCNSNYSDETEWRYSRLTFGKGLYNDFDVFASFVPPTGGTRISDYGGQLRWSFYQAKFLPINMSLLGHFNYMNFNDVFMNRNLGADLLIGVSVDHFAVYFGGGMIESKGTFVGQDSLGTCNEDCLAGGETETLNQNSRTVSHRVVDTHMLVGFSLHYMNLFAAAEVDRYQDAVYSLKLGLRY